MLREKNLGFFRRSECITETSIAMATRRMKNSQDCGFGINSIWAEKKKRSETLAGFSMRMFFYLPPRHSMCINDVAANNVSQLMISYLIVEGCDLVGQRAVLVYQKTEAPLLFQQSLPAAICQEQLHVHLTARQCFQALATNTDAALCHQNRK